MKIERRDLLAVLLLILLWGLFLLFVRTKASRLVRS